MEMLRGRAWSAARGTVTIADRTFSFTPTVCMTDGVDTLVSGAGSEGGQESVYVDLDSTGPDEGELRIDLGAESMINSSERTIRSDPADVVLTTSGKSVTMTATFIDENDQRHDGSLEVDSR